MDNRSTSGNRSNRKNKSRRNRYSAKVVATVLAALMIFSSMGGFVSAEEVTGSTETAAVEEADEVSVPSDEEEGTTISVDDTVPSDEEIETPFEGEGVTDTPTEENNAKQNDLIVDAEEEEADTAEESSTAEEESDDQKERTFTISYSVFSTQRILYYVHAVDEDGQEISIPDVQDVEISSSKMAFSFADYAPATDGYDFKEAKLDNNSPVIGAELSVSGSALSISYKNGEEGVEDTSVSLTNDSAKETRDIYFVYEKKSSAMAGSDEKELSDGTKVAFTWGEDAGLTEGTSGEASLIIKDSDDYKTYEEKALIYLHENISEDVTIVDSRFFEIHLEKDDEKVQPEGTVDVKISLADPIEADNIMVLHFTDDGDIEAVDAETSADEVSFKADSFSVYGIVGSNDPNHETTYRRTYTFQNDDGSDYNFTLNNNPGTGSSETNQQIVKNGGTLLDVGTPVSTVDSSREFIGWGVVSGDTVDTDNLITLPMTVSGLSSDDSATLRAVYSDEVTVTFYDIDNETVLQVEKAEPESTLDLSEYEAVPANPQTQQFIGWSTEKNQTSNPLSSSYTVPNSSVSLYPVIANGHWLRFDSQGGTAEPSVFVQEDQAAGTLPTPARAGYDFEGWYTSASGGTAVGENLTISSDTTVFAHWSPKTDTNYTVVYWKQNANDDNYTFDSSETLTGTTGQQTQVTASDDKYTGFHLSTDSDHALENATIAGDGSTVINVYYDRNLYDITFSTFTRDSSGGYYYFPGGYIYTTSGNYSHYSAGYYQAGTGPWSSSSHYNGENATYYTSESRYASANYRYYLYSLNPRSSWTIHAKYEASIGDEWPTYSDSDESTTWYVLNSDGSIDRSASYSMMFTMPLNGYNLVLTGNTGSYEYTFAYYLMDTDGNYPAVNNPTYSPEISTSSSGMTFYTWYELEGFTYDQSISAKQGDEAAELWTSGSTTFSGWKLYYQRNKYSIEFHSGDTTVATKTDIYYGADISDAADDVTVTPPEGEKFDGWYATSDGYGDPYNFTTMPSGNIIVYAKFSSIQCTVTYDANGGTLRDGLADSETLEYGGKATEYTLGDISREGYEFLGWYKRTTDGNGHVSDTYYDFSQQVTEDTTLVAHWRKTGTFYVRYMNTDPSNGNADGEIIQTDTYKYADLADVKVLAAPASDKIPSGYEFIGWSDGTTVYHPGDTFTLDASKAVESTETVNGESVTGQFVTLRAVYTKLNTTYIQYHANGGSGTLTDVGNGDNIQRNIEPNADTTLSSGDGFTREGYKLIGWNTNSEADGTSTYASTRYKLGGKYGVDGISGNTLYAEWQDERLTTVTVTEVTTGNDADTSQKFSFTVTYTDKDGNSKTDTFELANGETSSFTALAGNSVVITQTLVSGYDLAITSSDYSGTENNTTGRYVISSLPSDDGTVTFTNTKNKVISDPTTSQVSKITVNKVWKNADGTDIENPGVDSVTANVMDSEGNTVQALILNSGNSWTATTMANLTETSGYTVQEANVPDGYTSTVSGSETKTVFDTTVYNNISSGKTLLLSYTSGDTTYLLTRSGSSGVTLEEATKDSDGNITPTDAQKWTATSYNYGTSTYWSLSNGGYYLSIGTSTGSSSVGLSSSAPTGTSDDTALALGSSDDDVTVRRYAGTSYLVFLTRYYHLSLSGTTLTVTQDTSSSGGTGFTPYEEVQNASYTITNTKKSVQYTVTVIKNVVGGSDTDKATNFSFTATGLTSDEDTFQLSNGGQKVYSGVNADSKISITEAAADGFSSSLAVTKLSEDGTSTEEVTANEDGTYTITGDTTFTFTNTKSSKRNPDSSYITVTKTFSGIEQVPADFTLNVGENALTASSATSSTDSDGNTVLTWKISGLETGTYTVTESGADVSGHNLSATVNGSTLSSSGASVTISAATVTFTEDTSIKNPNNETTFPIDSEHIICASLTGDTGVIVVTKAPLDAAQRAGVKTAISNLNGSWKDEQSVTFYSTEGLEDGTYVSTLRGGFTYHNTSGSQSITFDSTSNWNHAYYGTMSITGTANADISVSNTYEADIALTGISLDHSSRIIFLLVLCFAGAGTVGFYLRRRRT